LEAIWTVIWGHKEWLFSGIGVFILGSLVNFFRKKNDSSTQIIRSGNASINIQAGRDIDLGINKNSNVDQE